VNRRLSRKLGWNVIGLLVFVFMVFPVFWMVSTAFKSEDQINSFNPTWIPSHPTLAHFTAALHQQHFWADVKNTMIIVLVTISISLVAAFLAAVALAKYRFAGRAMFIVLVIGIQMLPPIGLVIPLYVLLGRYGLVNTLTGVILVYFTFALPFAVWVLRGFLIGIPKELEEAAMVDGSTRLGAFVRILLPLVAPGLAATSIFAFITVWNEYIFASIILHDNSKQTITLWLTNFLGGSIGGVDWGVVMAASTLIAIPVVIFFLLVQRRIAFGLTTGAVKA